MLLRVVWQILTDVSEELTATIIALMTEAVSSSETLVNINILSHFYRLEVGSRKLVFSLTLQSPLVTICTTYFKNQ
jgi:NADH:ubiquinone oxidoreductase subunit K